ncbi:MAG: hypothetical protein ABIP81_07515 [Terriglobales bacterium]
MLMGDVRVDGRNSPPVTSPEEMVGRFQAELMSALPGWKERLTTNPGQLGELEREVQSEFERGAGLLVVGLLAVAMKSPAFDAACERTRRGFEYPLAAGRMRQIRVRLLSGLVMWVTSLYCAPRKSWFGRPDAKLPGAYVELAQFGFAKGCTPGLQSKVARQAALCPSLRFAQQELQRDGVLLDVKTVGRIARQCGEGLLRLRMTQLELWREGKLPAGKELAGQRVSVQIDGGRTRIRGDLREAPVVREATDADGLLCEDAPGRSRKQPRKTFDADWREPKVMTIFVHDAEGRMVKASRATIDGTLLGPDAVAELVAMHLHRLGAAQALSITFVADGGVWIWDRVPTIVRLAKLDGIPVHAVLDCYHAAHHISLALAALGYTDQERMPLYREHRTLLRNGQWRRVVDELTDLAAEMPRDTKVWTEIAYLQKHGEAGRLKYPTFRGLGLPLGSGAIESSIRRVINLRLKGNAIYWREDMAESMLQIRAQVLTNRWDERLDELRHLTSRDARTTWRWTPQNMSSKSERDVPSSA